MGGDVKSLQVEVAGKKGLPLPLVKRILLHTLRGLANMHHCQIVHTDLKQDNIMFDTGSIAQDDITMFINTDPARRHPPEESWECIVQAAVSQPLPLLSLAEAITRTYIVSDFGSGEQWLGCPTCGTVLMPGNQKCNLQPCTLLMRSLLTPFAPQKSFFRAHGTIRLTSGHLDVWCIVVSLFCTLAADCINSQIFELIVGGSLFEYKSYPEYMLDEPTGHLWQMLCFTRERMTREQVNSSKLGAQYFDLTVKPNDIDNPFCLSFC